MLRIIGSGCLWLSLALALCANAQARGGTPAFSNQTATSGLDSVAIPLYELGVECCNQLGGGTVGDFNNDGWIDVFHPVGGGAPDRLFINDGDGTFTERAQEWGIAEAHRSTAAVAGDFDGDGWVDLYVASFGTPDENRPAHHKLYRNLRGAGFVDVAGPMGLKTTDETDGDGWGGAWGDYDLDGDLDLAIIGYKTDGGKRLFRNDGDRFTDVTATAGLTDSLSGILGYTVRFADMDGDRFPEMIWIADNGGSVYFVNNGDGTFTDFTEESNTSMDLTEMGQAVADWNGDGLLDFYVTTIQTNNLYIHQGGNVFLNQGGPAGVEETGTGWGTVPIHLDHDTRLDIAATALTSRQYAFLNQTAPGGELTFSEIAQEIGLDSTMSGRGLSSFDYDNDGDQDLLFFPNSGPIELYRNDLSGADTGWLRIQLTHGCKTSIPPAGIGSIVRIRLGEEWYTSRIDGGSNYVGQSEMTAHFGLGAATVVDEVRVEWSDGSSQTLTEVAGNQTVTISAADFCDYCEATPNSSGDVGKIEATGSPLLADNELVIRASGLPAFARASLVAADERDFEAGFRGSEGNRCLTVPGHRINDEPLFADESGELEVVVDLSEGRILAGETWHFQVWFEDPAPGHTFNATDGASASLR